MLKIILPLAFGFFCIGFLLSAQELASDTSSSDVSESEDVSSNEQNDENIICQYLFNPELELMHLFREREEVEQDCNKLEEIFVKKPLENSAKLAYTDCMYYMRQIDNDIVYFTNLTQQGVTMDPACQEIMLMDDEYEEEGEEEGEATEAPLQS